MGRAVRDEDGKGGSVSVGALSPLCRGLGYGQSLTGLRQGSISYNLSEQGEGGRGMRRLIRWLR